MHPCPRFCDVLCAAVLLSSVVACTHAAATASPGPEPFEKRQASPRFASSEPVPELPPRRHRAYSEQGLVVLQEPRHLKAARRIVRDFFDAIVRESQEDLDQTLGSQAWIETGNRGSRQRAQSFWRSRFSRLDYTRLQGRAVFRKAELSIYDASQSERLAGSRTLQIKPKGEQLVVVAPIATPRLGSDRFFGEKIVFVLEPVQTSYRIVLMFEDFRLR